MSQTPDAQRSLIEKFHELCVEAACTRTQGTAQHPASPKSDWIKIVVEVERLLDAGLDPNVVDDEGITPLGRLGMLTRGTNLVANEIAERLLARGANPLINDAPFGHAIRHKTSSSLTMKVFDFLRRAELEDKGVRDEHGGNMLHYLAWNDALLAASHLEDDDITEPGEENFPSPMINQRRLSDGDTPLDVLWGGSAMTRRASDWAPDDLEVAWEMTRTLIARGADPLFRGNDGTCVAERMEALVNDGMPTDSGDIWRRIEAALTQQRLETHTAMGANTAKGGMRL